MKSDRHFLDGDGGGNGRVGEAREAASRGKERGGAD